MGAFVLGILVGWLAEWLFYTFLVKGGDKADCAALKSQLEEKKREISSLQGKLEAALAESATKKSSPSIAEVLSTGSATVTSKKATSTNIPKTVTSAEKQSPKKAATSTATKPAKKAAEKKSSATKAPAKTTAKPKAKTKSATKKGDDFTKLSGIGPSMAATLKELGIDSFAKLAATDDDILRDMLDASGARMNNNKEAMDSWNEQATLAAKGDFKALKKMQEAMKK